MSDTSFFGLFIAEVQSIRNVPGNIGLITTQLHVFNKKEELKSFPPENIFVFWFKLKLQIDTLN